MILTELQCKILRIVTILLGVIVFLSLYFLIGYTIRRFYYGIQEVNAVPHIGVLLNIMIFLKYGWRNEYTRISEKEELEILESINQYAADPVVPNTEYKHVLKKNTLV